MTQAKGHIISRKTSWTDYVQDGLVAVWDAIENNGKNPHEDRLTVWNSLVGGYSVAIPTGAPPPV